jgi:hypothetical protein
MSPPIPKTITGGCLCGGVRYQVEFALDHDWKFAVGFDLASNSESQLTLKPHTCQCTQCRKNSGTLVYHFHTATASELTWLSKSTYAEYNSSPGCVRGFCKNCGSPLFWTDNKVNTDIELAVGTFDEEYLMGGRDSDDKPTGAFAMALANPEGDHHHVRNQIQGITDGISVLGTRYWKGSKEGPMP